MILWKIMVQNKQNGGELKNTCFKDILKDQSISLILILIELKRIPVQ